MKKLFGFRLSTPAFFTQQRGMTGVETLFVLAVIVAFTACITSLNGCTPKPVNPICLQPGYEQSVICAIAAKMGTTPEQMDAMVLDASLIAVATKQVKAAEFRSAIAKVREWVDQRGTLTMSRIYGYVMGQGQIDPALALLISRRLQAYATIPDLSERVFLPVDRAMVLAHLDHQTAQFAGL